MKDRLRYVWENLDAILVMVIAALVLGYTIIGEPKPELLQKTIVALLGAVAFVLLRDRRERGRLDDFAGHLKGLEAFVNEIAGDLASDRPYKVKNEKNTWDITDRRAATFSRVQEVCFTRNEISTLDHWCSGTGSVETCTAYTKYSADAVHWNPLDDALRFGHDNGDKYIFSLGATYSRGDELHWRLVASLVDRFPAQHETVSLELGAETHQPVMRVIWPEDQPPKHVDLRMGDQAKRQIHPRRDDSGRMFVEERVAPTKIGDVATIEWVW